MAAQLRFGNLHLNKTTTFGTISFGHHNIKVEIFNHIAQHHVWRNPNTANGRKHLIPTVKYGGLVLQPQPGHPVVTELTMSIPYLQQNE